MLPLRRFRTLLALTGVVVLVGASLIGSPALAKCGKDCKRLITGDFITCKRRCPKHKAGKACRMACLDKKKTDRAACKTATNPTPPECGETTTTTTVSVSSTTTAARSSTTTAARGTTTTVSVSSTTTAAVSATTTATGGTTTTAAGSTTTTVAVSTTTTPVSGTTTTTGGSVVVVGSLPATPGRFNYNLTLGLDGANSACSTSFAGAHACTLSELHNTPASALMGLKDTSSPTPMPVTSFWAIDPAADPVTAQCCNDVSFNPCTSAHNWEYGTAHTTSRGQKVALDNATGALGTLTTGVQCNFAPNNWVGCCK